MRWQHFEQRVPQSLGIRLYDDEDDQDDDDEEDDEDDEDDGEDYQDDVDVGDDKPWVITDRVCDHCFDLSFAICNHSCP